MGIRASILKQDHPARNLTKCSRRPLDGRRDGGGGNKKKKTPRNDTGGFSELLHGRGEGRGGGGWRDGLGGKGRWQFQWTRLENSRILKTPSCFNYCQFEPVLILNSPFRFLMMNHRRMNFIELQNQRKKKLNEGQFFVVVVVVVVDVIKTSGGSRIKLIFHLEFCWSDHQWARQWRVNSHFLADRTAIYRALASTGPI